MSTVLLLLLLQGESKRTDPPVEETKKNIKVLQGLPTSQLIPTMAFMANSLGVTCAHCHGRDWASDEKPAKNAARQMITLQRSINQSHYSGFRPTDGGRLPFRAEWSRGDYRVTFTVDRVESEPAP